MPSVKKIKPLNIIEQSKFIGSLRLHHEKELLEKVSNKTTKKYEKDVNNYEKEVKGFESIYGALSDAVYEILKWEDYLARDIFYFNEFKAYETYSKRLDQSQSVPLKIKDFVKTNGLWKEKEGAEWVFNGYVYKTKKPYSDDEVRLLILDDFDMERIHFEKLKAKFVEVKESSFVFERPRIPENVRIEVWRRDGGKCARCGGREKLEYDHIVPISKGGSNTVRNIELLCEKHNRSKSNNVV